MEWVARPFDREKDKEAFTEFLRKRGDESVVDFSFFPPTGCMVEYWGRPVCAGFMIICDNNTCINTDIISHPDAPKHVRNKAVLVLREYLEGKAKEYGIPFIIAHASHPGLKGKLLEQGYKVLNENITHMGRNTWL